MISDIRIRQLLNKCWFFQCFHLWIFYFLLVQEIFFFFKETVSPFLLSLDSEHSCTCSGGEGMGQREGRPTPPVAEREEPEGLEEGSNNFSLLAIDKRVFGRLQVVFKSIYSFLFSLKISLFWLRQGTTKKPFMISRNTKF